MNVISSFATALCLSALVGFSLWVLLEEGQSGIQLTDDIGLLE